MTCLDQPSAVVWLLLLLLLITLVKSQFRLAIGTLVRIGAGALAAVGAKLEQVMRTPWILSRFTA